MQQTLQAHLAAAGLDAAQTMDLLTYAAELGAAEAKATGQIISHARLEEIINEELDRRCHMVRILATDAEAREQLAGIGFVQAMTEVVVGMPRPTERTVGLETWELELSQSGHGRLRSKHSPAEVVWGFHTFCDDPKIVWFYWIDDFGTEHEMEILLTFGDGLTIEQRFDRALDAEAAKAA